MKTIQGHYEKINQDFTDDTWKSPLSVRYTGFTNSSCYFLLTQHIIIYHILNFIPTNLLKRYAIFFYFFKEKSPLDQTTLI